METEKPEEGPKQHSQNREEGLGGEAVNSVSIVNFGQSEKSLIEIVSQKNEENAELESNDSGASSKSSFFGKGNCQKDPGKQEPANQHEISKIEPGSVSNAEGHKLETAEDEIEEEGKFPKKASSLECILSREDLSRGKGRAELFEQKKQSRKKRDKLKILTIPETKSKIGIYHFDSMSNEDSKKEYLIICKMFKHIVNYLFIKEINQRLQNSEIVFEREIRPFQTKRSRPSDSPKDNSDWEASSRNSADLSQSRLPHKQQKSESSPGKTDQIPKTLARPKEEWDY